MKTHTVSPRFVTTKLIAALMLCAFGCHNPAVLAQAKKPVLAPAASKSIMTDAVSQGMPQAPQAQGLEQRLIVFPYDPNAIYPINTRVANFTRITMSAGEQVTGFYLSDTLSWEFHVTSDKKDVMVKPKAAGISTTATIKTNKRAYELDFKEVRSADNPSWHQRVSWQVSEPAFEDAAAQTATAVMPVQQAPAAQSMTTAGSAQSMSQPQSEEGECRGLTVDLTKVNQQYAVKGDAVFAPKGADSLVFDNGQHTFVRLPASVQEVPAIFGLDRSGQAELVNYRFVCGMYKIDRVMDYGLLLKLGDQEVSITRKTANCGLFGLSCSSNVRNISQ